MPTRTEFIKALLRLPILAALEQKLDTTERYATMTVLFERLRAAKHLGPHSAVGRRADSDCVESLQRKQIASHFRYLE